MKWDRAVHHVDALAQSCAEMASRPTFSVRVTGLWAVGDILGPPRDLDWVTVALGVDLPPEEVAWWTLPSGSQHWAQATRLAKNPVLPWWRSAHAPVWNHRVVRPVLLWDEADGTRTEAIAALRDGRAESIRPAGPDPAELAARLRDELAVSRAALRAATEEYDQKRWGRGNLEALADPLWRASDGFLDVFDAVSAGSQEDG